VVAAAPARPERARGRGLALAARVLVVLGMVVSCRPSSGRTARPERQRREAHFTWLRTPAAGRPSTCPEDAVDFGDGVPTTHAQRCSFADAERDLVSVRGKLLREVPGGLASGIAEAEIVLVELAEDGTEGRPLARATTDAQGAFHLRVNLKPGSYALVGAGARTAVDVVKKGPRSFADVWLLAPAQPSGPP